MLTALVILGLAVDAPAAALAFSAWSAPVNLGPTINSPFAEFGPVMSHDGFSLYISSNTTRTPVPEPHPLCCSVQAWRDSWPGGE